MIIVFVVIGSLLLGLFLVVRSRLIAMRNLRAEEHKRFEKEKELAALHSSVQALEEERQRVAMDLHDGIGVLTNAAKLWVSQVEGAIESVDQKEKLIETKEVLTQISNDVRRIAHNMMPSSLSKLGLKVAIEELAESVQTASNIHIETDMDAVPWENDDAKNLTLYRIVQELINNGIKHSKAEVISIELRSYNDHVMLTYEDDGVGLNTNDSDKKGNGLGTMRSRIEYAGGEMHLRKGNAKGTMITFKLSK
ncbi:MAG: hypothetical protein Salg2KO_22500 [Salibacteraceae bacterium]